MQCRAEILLAASAWLASCGAGGEVPPVAGCPACAPGRHCDASTGACVCDDPCTTAGPVCDPAASGRIGLCVEEPDGCHVVADLASCGGAARCEVGASSCDCPEAPCSAGEVRCAGADGVWFQQCAADAGGCLAWADATCPSDLVCDPDAAAQGIAPPCGCPPTPECTVGDLRNAPLTGTPERCGLGAHDCPAWLPVCPAPARAGTLVVDPAAGDDAMGTGASSPPECALRTLGRALALVPAGGTIVARPGTYCAASGETFPLEVGPEVTIESDGAQPASAYVIDGSGATTLATGDTTATLRSSQPGVARVRRLTVTAAASAYLFVCDDGEPVLDGVVLSGGDTGAGVVATCAATLSGVVVEAPASTAVRIATTGVTTTLDGVRLDGQGLGTDGLRVDSGQVMASDVEVTGFADHGIVLQPASSGGTGEDVAASATGLVVHANGGDGIALSSASSGTMGFGAVALSSSEVFLNGGAGIAVSAAAPSLSGLDVHDNAGPGIRVVALVSGVAVTVDASSIRANGGGGGVGGGLQLGVGTVRISGTATAPTAVNGNDGPGIQVTLGTLVADGITISGNSQGGLVTSGVGSPLVTLRDSVVSNNVGGAGVTLASGAVGTVERCDIFGNGGGSGAGGVWISTSEPLVSFVGNRIHANLYDGITVRSRHQDLGPSSCGVDDADANWVYCYGTEPFSGLPNHGISASGGGSVRADYTVWANADPDPATYDYTNGVYVNPTRVCGGRSSCQ